MDQPTGSADILAGILPEAQRVEIARRYLDGAEVWLRRIVEYEFTRKHGPAYFVDGVIRSGIRQSVEKLKASSPGRFNRDIDATSFEQLIEILANHENYRGLFASALKGAYPNGPNEAKTFLERLVLIRNSVQHGNGCTTRQLERIVCYTNDLTDCLKGYFAVQSETELYPVPTIIGVRDNMGNRSTRESMQEGPRQLMVDLRKGPHGDLRPNDNLLIEVDVDPTYTPEQYQIRWRFGRVLATGSVLSTFVGDEHVSEFSTCNIAITTAKSWHKHGEYDDKVVLIYRVLPPL